MKNSPINVSILPSSDGASHAICIWQDRGDEVLAFVPTSVANGEARWGWASVEVGAPPPPSFLLPFSLVKRGIVQELVDEIARELGVVATKVKESDSLIEMKEAHLQDLRNILFGSDWVQVERGKIERG